MNEKLLNIKQLNSTKVFLLLSLVLLPYYSIGQNNIENTKELTGELGKDISVIFQTGEIEVEIIGVDPKLQELSLKMAVEIQKKLKWYLEYLTEHRNEKIKPYHENLGISKEDYEMLERLKANLEFVKIGSGNIKSVDSGRKMSFESEGDLEIFNQIEIDLDSNFIDIGDQRLEFVREIRVEDAKNGFNSKWKGFMYETKMDITLLSNPIDPSKMNLIKYEIMIGQLESNARYIIKVSGLKMINGKPEGILLNLII